MNGEPSATTIPSYPRPSPVCRTNLSTCHSFRRHRSEASATARRPDRPTLAPLIHGRRRCPAYTQASLGVADVQTRFHAGAKDAGVSGQCRRVRRALASSLSVTTPVTARTALWRELSLWCLTCSIHPSELGCRDCRVGRPGYFMVHCSRDTARAVFRIHDDEESASLRFRMIQALRFRMTRVLRFRATYESV